MAGGVDVADVFEACAWARALHGYYRIGCWTCFRAWLQNLSNQGDSAGFQARQTELAGEMKMEFVTGDGWSGQS